MISTKRDVIVVGAGPAGAICAAYLAKTGVDVLLLDKDIFPRDKACGDMQCEGIVAHVSALGAFDALDEMGTCIRNIHLISNSGNEVALPFDCYCTPRYQFDTLMTDTAGKWGAEFWQGCRVIDIIEECGYIKGVKVKFRGEEWDIRSDIVIAADGAYSDIAKAAGVMKEESSGIYLGQRAYFQGIKLNKNLARDRYNAYGVFCFDKHLKPGYAWVMPTGRDSIENGYCNVGMMVYDRDSYKGMNLQERFYKCLDDSPKFSAMFEQAEQVSPWQGGKLTDVTQNMRKVGNGFMLIGDAASVMLPLTNDGLSTAADSAQAAASAAAEAIKRNDFSEEYLASKYSLEVNKEKLKLTQLTQQSMYDANVSDRFIQRLEKDPSYLRAVADKLVMK